MKKKCKHKDAQIMHASRGCKSCEEFVVEAFSPPKPKSMKVPIREWEDRFEKEFLVKESEGVLRFELSKSGGNIGTLIEFIRNELALQRKSIIEEMKEPKEMPTQGYLMAEGLPCPFCKGTGSNQNQNILC